MTASKGYLPWILLALSVAGTVYQDYRHDDRELVQRVAALEVKTADQDKDISYIRTQVDKLVEWALGHK